MDFIYFINLIAAFILLFVPAWFSIRILGLSAINPFTLLLLASFPVEVMKLFMGPAVLIDDGLFDIGYQFAILMNNIQVLSQAVGLFFYYKIFSKVDISKFIPFKKTVLSKNDFKKIEIFFLSIFIISFYMLASAEYGVINWIINPRIGYQAYRMGQGHLYAISISSLAIAITSGFLYKSSVKNYLKVGFIYFIFAYLLGSKGLLLNLFVTILIFLWFIHWRYLKLGLLLGGLIVFSMMGWNLYLSSANDFEIKSLVSYFDYFKNAADYYREYLNGGLDLFYGTVYLTSLWGYIPRSLFPEKPFVYGVLLVNELFFPGQAELTNTPAFGGAVEQFADFGVIGVIFSGLCGINTIMLALFSRYIYKNPGIDFKKVTIASTMVLIIQYSPGFGTFFPGILYIFLMLITVIFIKGISLLKLSFRD